MKSIVLIFLILAMFFVAGAPLFYLYAISDAEKIKDLEFELDMTREKLTELKTNLVAMGHLHKTELDAVNAAEHGCKDKLSVTLEMHADEKRLRQDMQNKLLDINKNRQKEPNDPAPGRYDASPRGEYGVIKHAFELGDPKVRAHVRQFRVNVLLQYYQALDAQRHQVSLFYNYSNHLQELQGALQANLACIHVKSVHLLLENENLTIDHFSDFFMAEKLVLHPVGHRMDAKEAMEYANHAFEDKTPVVLVNSDVFLDNTARFFAHLAFKKKPTAYFISRRRTFKVINGNLLFDEKKDASHMRDHCLKYGGSHDAFAWVTPLPQHLVDSCAFQWGSEGFENRFAFEFMQAKYDVKNPCFNIAVHHMQGDYGIDSGPTPPKSGKRLNIGKSAIARPTFQL